ncbi:MAG: sugar-binding transcriptional regulator [Acidimicrobiales bacterium]|jgi:DNA-binding transcriptional regulator LsrR (DeoR family)
MMNLVMTAPVPASADLEVIGKAARLHYEYGLTHQEVADVLHVSRVKVTRLLKQARDLGIVQIRVLPDVSPYAGLEMELANRFNLDEAIVVPTMADDLDQRRALAVAAARYLQRVLHHGMTVAIGLSRTVALIPQYVVDPRPANATFVSLVGGMRRYAIAANPYEGAERLAQLFGGTAEHLLAPAIAGSPAIAEAFFADPGTVRTLERAASADLALLGIAATDDHTTLVDEDELTSDEISSLIESGAVGDTAARFFDANGASVTHEIDSRIIGLTLTQIRQIPLRIVVAGGISKTEALRGALRGGLAAVVVLDAQTAQQVLGEPFKKGRRQMQRAGETQDPKPKGAQSKKTKGS